MHASIYLIYPKNKQNIKLYIGSSVTLKHRKRQHKNNCNNPCSKKHNLQLYKHIRDNGGWEAFAFHIVEERDDFIDETDIRKREQYHLNRIPKQFSLNEHNAYSSPEERAEYIAQWKKANAKRTAEYRRKWHAANTEKALEYNKRWHNKNPDYMRNYMRARYQKMLLEKADKNEKVQTTK